MVNERPNETPPPDSANRADAPASPGGAATPEINHIVTPADLAGSLRARAEQYVDSGDLDTIEADYQFELADFVERFNCWPKTRRPVHRDWFRFGEVQVMFADDDNDGGFWTTLVDAHTVSGMDYQAIRDMFEEDRADGYDDVFDLEWLVNDDGDKQCVPLVRHSFLMRAMLRGPWSREFMENTMGLFRRALVNSGLGDKIGPVLVVKDGVATETNMTFNEFMAGSEELPSEEDAARQAFRGPLGGVL